MSANTTSLKTEYKERIAPELMKHFGYSSIMQVPKLSKIVINQGLGIATGDKKIIDVAIEELSAITGQKGRTYLFEEGYLKLQVASQDAYRSYGYSSS